MSWLRALAFNIAFVAVTVLLGVAGLPMLLAPRRRVMGFGRFWARCVLALLKAIVGLDGEVRGLEHLPRGPSIIAMKHQSAWDTLILPVVLGDPAVVLKRELFLVPFYGWYAARAGSIAIDRRGGAGALRRMVTAARHAASAGRPVVIFPEGTRARPGELVRFHRGFAHLATLLDADIQLVLITCTPSTLTKGEKWWAIPPHRPVFRVSPAGWVRAESWRGSPHRSIAVRAIVRRLERLYNDRLAIGHAGS